MFKAQSSKLSGSSSYHESGSHNPFLYIIFRDGAFHLTDKDICRFLSYSHTSLFHSGKHRITRLGTVTPLVKPQMLISSGTAYPIRLAV